MHVLKGIRTILINETDVTDIVGPRIYSYIVPQKAELPFVLMDVISVRPSDCKNSSSEMDAHRVQIDSFGRTASETADMDNIIRNTIDRIASGSIGGVSIDGIKYDGTIMQYEEERNIKVLSSDYQVRVLRNVVLPAMPDVVDGQFASDAAAAIGGIAIGQYYELSDDNIYGMTGGVPKKRKE
jgi:hypothetical protein